MIELTNVTPMIPIEINTLLEQLTDGVLDEILMLDSMIQHQALVRGAPVTEMEGVTALIGLVLRGCGEVLCEDRLSTQPKLANYHVANLAPQINKLLRARLKELEE